MFSFVTLFCQMPDSFTLSNDFTLVCIHNVTQYYGTCAKENISALTP